ncbi:WUSCHEL-related homeobox [Striga asiatica]|uniref:Protein WUSCHEL n=1 Tax=Striga asiatica TaxID=4170 RepID=A0A5A7R3K4_STRAF|nr:WUSCHEL-related homeobox [Striga asiatica]
MDDQEKLSGSPDPVLRTRWIPKPEQILILESIFNGGTVNPTNNETVRFRKLLEKYGPVGDANVFYWFQNRRSRTHRRRRQIQAAAGDITRGGAVRGDNCDPLLCSYGPTMDTSAGMSPSSSFGPIGVGADSTSNGPLSFLGHPTCFQEVQQDSGFWAQDSSISHYGVITVFINGVETSVRMEPLDTKTMFGEGFILFHSSGVAVEVDERGFLLQPLHHGESYFLVPRH